MSSEDLAQLGALTQAIAGTWNGESFWLLGQPSTIIPLEPDQDVLAFSLAGWIPEQAIVVACNFRGAAADVLLAFFAGRLADLFCGLVALGFKLESYTRSPSMLTLDGRYCSDGLGDVVTPACLNYWARDPEFRMC
ncbi:DUF6368 family protein [Pelomonas cellulosilytica]|uniref:DUF6368 family protein n=1 Tax=Pelomonas cellulosilytica TaxID=2906762 RepID=UPI003B012C12